MRRLKSSRVALDLRGLISEQELFRVSIGHRQDPQVGIWFLDGPPELRSIAQKWFTRMRQCGADVLELLHDGCPVACVQDAPFGYVNCFKSHVNVGFFNGAALTDPAGLLEGNGKRMRHVKLKPALEPNSAALGELIDAAYLDIRARLARKSPSH